MLTGNGAYQGTDDSLPEISTGCEGGITGTIGKAAFYSREMDSSWAHSTSGVKEPFLSFEVNLMAFYWPASST